MLLPGRGYATGEYSTFPILLNFSISANALLLTVTISPAAGRVFFER